MKKHISMMSVKALLFIGGLITIINITGCDTNTTCSDKNYQAQMDGYRRNVDTLSSEMRYAIRIAPSQEVDTKAVCEEYTANIRHILKEMIEYAKSCGKSTYDYENQLQQLQCYT